MRSYRKTYKSSKVCLEKILKKKTIFKGELLLKLIESLQLRENLSLSTLFPEKLDCFRKKIQESEDNPDSEWEPDGDSDDCSEPESDDDGNAFDAFDDGLWLVISKRVSILLEFVF